MPPWGFTFDSQEYTVLNVRGLKNASFIRPSNHVHLKQYTYLGF